MFYELLQIAIGNRDRFSQAPTVEEWRELFALAQKQAMVGIAFRGVEQLSEEQRPPKQLLMQWYMVTERIKKMNADLDRKALAVAEKFRGEGFPGVVLKGQGIAKLYVLRDNDDENDNCHPEENIAQHNDERLTISEANSQQPTANLSIYRTPGDIDIWLFGERKEILDYVRRHVPDCKPVYHHVDFPVVEGLDIEVHFTPSWMNSPVTNRRLQQFFMGDRLEVKGDRLEVKGDRLEVKGDGLEVKGDGLEVKGDGLEVIGHLEGNTTHYTLNAKQAYTELPVPSLAFNRVYILVHIYRHLFAEGIGLRQLLDYYFVLCQGFTEEEREETMRVLRSLKMERFASAVMWVLQAVYGMDDRYLLVAPDEREGGFLLDEIMLAGNFGQYDERLQHEQGESALHWGWRKVVRNFRFVRSYPSEVLWSPFFKLWHYFWRKGL